MQIRFERLKYEIGILSQVWYLFVSIPDFCPLFTLILFSTYLSGYKVYMCALFVHILYCSSKLLSNVLANKNIYRRHHDVLNNLW